MKSNLVNLQDDIPQIGCKQCDGYGNILTLDGIRPCECKNRVIINQYLKEANIPPMYAKKSFETFSSKNKNQKEVLEQCCNYVNAYQADGRGLLFVGGCGTGKTHLAISILRELIGKGHPGLFYNIISLLDDLRASYALDSNASQWPILEKTCGIEILILDDLGSEKTSGWVNDRLYAIINQRYEQKKTTIVTTNRDQIELGEQIGGRIYSRLMEMCKTIPFTGQDYRIQMMRSGKI